MRFPAPALLCLPFLFGGCHSGSHTTQFGGTTISRDDSSGRTTITNKGASITTLSGAAMQAIVLPAYAPRYPGSTVVAALSSSDRKGQSQTVRMDTGDPGTAVMPFYRRALASNGLAIDTDLVLPNGGGMLTGKSKAREVSITIDPEDGKTAIVISMTQHSH